MGTFHNTPTDEFQVSGKKFPSANGDFTLEPEAEARNDDLQSVCEPSSDRGGYHSNPG